MSPSYWLPAASTDARGGPKAQHLQGFRRVGRFSIAQSIRPGKGVIFTRLAIR
jgi:hypothetical protein